MNGPSWLNKQEENWHVSILKFEKVPEQKRVFANLMRKNEIRNEGSVYTNEVANTLFQNLGNFSKLIRVVPGVQV